MTRADAAVVAYWVTFGAVLALLLTSCSTPQARKPGAELLLLVKPEPLPPHCRETLPTGQVFCFVRREEQ